VETLGDVPVDYRTGLGADARAKSSEHLLETIGERVKPRVGVDAVFGQPRTVGDRTIIPVARIAYGFGMGAGAGKPAEDGGENAEQAGAGGGAAAMATPVAVVEVTPGGVRVIPVVDVVRLVTRVLLFVGIISVMGILFGSRARGQRFWARGAAQTLG
jgi:uncharacterized spore protein YtfJ